MFFFFWFFLNFALQIPQKIYIPQFTSYKSRAIYVRVCIWFIKYAGRTRGLFLFIIFSIYFAYFLTISLFIYLILLLLSLYPVKLCLSLRFCYCLWFIYLCSMAYDFWLTYRIFILLLSIHKEKVMHSYCLLFLLCFFFPNLNLLLTNVVCFNIGHGIWSIFETWARTKFKFFKKRATSKKKLVFWLS